MFCTVELAVLCVFRKATLVRLRARSLLPLERVEDVHPNQNVSNVLKPEKENPAAELII